MAEDASIPPAAVPPIVKRRTPQKKMTDEDKATLIEILKRPDARVDGKIHIPTIAAMTGLTYNQITRVVDSDPYFKAQKGEVNPGKVVPTEADLIDPPASLVPMGVTISQDDFERMRALFRQQKKMLSGDWVGLGLNQDMGDKIEKLAQLGSAPLYPLISAIHGGLIKDFMFLQQTLELDAEHISANQLPGELDAKGIPVEDGKVQREWRYCWYAGYKLLMELQKSLHQNQAMLVRAMKDLKAVAPDAKKPEKGVYEVPVPEKEDTHAA